MSKLNEAAFLRSLRFDDEEIDQLNTSCPEPGILWAMMQKDRGNSAMAEDLRNHVAVCPSCLDLTKRLYAFQRAQQGQVSPKAEQSWAESRPKLNQWIDRFLDQQQQQRQAQPTPKPVAVIAPRPRTFNLTWAIPLAAGIALLAIVLFVESRHTAVDQNGGTQIATAPVRPGNESPATPSVPARTPDQLLMKKNGDAPTEASSGQAPPTITFIGNPRMRLLLKSVREMANDSYYVAGTLLPINSQNALFDSADVSGVFASTQPRGHFELKINSATLKGRNYRVSATDGDDQIIAVPVNGQAVPQLEQTIEIEITRGPSLHIEP